MIEKIKYLFFNESLRHWHFDSIIKESKVSRERVYHFLKLLQKEQLIVRYKEKGKMPYYLANIDSVKFKLEKRLFGLLMIQNLLTHLRSLEDVKTAILFGSFSRGNWSKSSDIDIFIFGDDSRFEKGKFETLLNREIQVFTYNNTKNMKKELDEKLIPNIAKGYLITDSMQPFEVRING